MPNDYGQLTLPQRKAMKAKVGCGKKFFDKE
jgi:hypothetical protein